MELKVVKIGSGDDAIFLTLTKMEQFAREDSKDSVIKKIANKLKNQTAVDKDYEFNLAKSVFDYVYKNVKYVHDEDIAGDTIPDWSASDRTEFLTRPKYLLSETYRGDCDDMAAACCALYLALGYRTTIKAIAWKPNLNGGKSEFSHVYSEVCLETTFGKPVWVPCDPVIPKLGLGFGREKDNVLRTEIREL
ncbi:MAG: hypothetical protein NT007_09530 [Candidatus Kapabacteria bacterium]|nr:hypothetical protein [Candidatus Kapabacteria bacterium]